MAVSETVTETRRALGPVGVWLGALQGEPAETQRSAARRIEALGYGSIFEGEIVGRNDVFAQEAAWLCATSRIVTGAGIANIWARHPATAQAAAVALGDAWPRRFVLGVGVSHGPVIDKTGMTYDQPLKRMREYLDGMDRATVAPPPRPVPRVLAALRRRMLELARDRTDGAHSYFVPPEHTADARQILGPDRLLIPEQAICLETDPAAARATAREHTSFYLRLPNYVNNLKRFGFTDEDVAGAGSDRLVDAIVAWGDPATIATRVRAHHDAGADHVLIQPLAKDIRGALRGLEELAGVLLPVSPGRR
ncbi:TIGR03620 family F420-dependent LLM class oxidoreductase [Dactylosporangium matsuzakiense]|uniref:LLM class F420-dependent oxidoreductase n=1 Tax=Dactylosporangium matsuzakiense TaxID=53360 RepID=A0A9W6KQE3_9ACTN|nr:TIGR03620 family F420-dependent LLM class oxidoreductase [Dactylosporangium matsuzakiense]UWZ42813.1 TIGR03620 family F420-dependent LLM class oxidoreductase [Dactylosporangium matsuzakiense]GLL04759.1 LLM class F420-dependent oxidoreductase [Dactylosporangium matsuzakiense]